MISTGLLTIVVMFSHMGNPNCNMFNPKTELISKYARYDPVSSAAFIITIEHIQLEVYDTFAHNLFLQQRFHLIYYVSVKLVYLTTNRFIECAI